MIKILVFAVMSCLIIFNLNEAASFTTTPERIRVDFENAEIFNIVTKIEKSSCGEADYISIGFEKYLGRAIYSSGNISFLKAGSIVIDVPITAYQIDKSIYEDSFHGTSFCLDQSIDYNIEISLFYNIGRRSSKVLIIELSELLGKK